MHIDLKPSFNKHELVSRAKSPFPITLHHAIKRDESGLVLTLSSKDNLFIALSTKMFIARKIGNQLLHRTVSVNHQQIYLMRRSIHRTSDDHVRGSYSTLQKQKEKRFHSALS